MSYIRVTNPPPLFPPRPPPPRRPRGEVRFKELGGLDPLDITDDPRNPNTVAFLSMTPEEQDELPGLDAATKRQLRAALAPQRGRDLLNITGVGRQPFKFGLGVGQGLEALGKLPFARGEGVELRQPKGLAQSIGQIVGTLGVPTKPLTQAELEGPMGTLMYGIPPASFAGAIATQATRFGGLTAQAAARRGIGLAGETVAPRLGATQFRTFPQVTGAAREPWQMPLQEYERDMRGYWQRTRAPGIPGTKAPELPSDMSSRLAQSHKQLVTQALSEGKPVPPEVLADYPELVQRLVPGAEKVTGVALPSPVKPTAFNKAGTFATEFTADNGMKITHIDKGSKKGWWRAQVGTTEYVGTTPESTYDLAARGGLAPAAPPPAPPAGPPAGKRPDDVLKRFTQFIHSPESLNLAELTQKMRSQQLGQRLAAMQKRTDELLVSGIKFEEALTRAQAETMTGAFDRPVRALVESLAEEVRDAAFARVSEVLKGDVLEQMSTAEALRNALAGKGIPRELGTAGGSAYTRLSKVFPPEVLSALERKRPLADALEDALLTRSPRGVGEWVKFPDEPILTGQRQGSLLPEASPGGLGTVVDPRTAEERAFDYMKLRGAPTVRTPPYTPPEESILAGQRQGSLLPEASPTGFPPGVLKSRRQIAQETLELKLYLAGKPTGTGLALKPLSPELDRVVKQPAMMPIQDRYLLVEALKTAGWGVIDTLNAVRANLASFDVSYWRQQAVLIMNHKAPFLRSNLGAWRAIFDRQFAEQSMERIMRHKYYPLYEEAARTGRGRDFLRPLSQKGLPAWQREEAFMVLGAERPIPKLVEKLPWIRMSQRSFVTGTNQMNWDIFTKYVDEMFAVNEKIAAGSAKAPRGGLSIKKEVDAFSAMLADMTGRAGLGPANRLSEAVNAGFFSIRLNLGRLFTPRHLLSANPRVRAEAAKNLVTFVGTMGGVLLLGEKQGLWDVEKNPYSSDFAKIRVGNVRIDPWGGYQQFAVFAGRIASGQYKSASTGQQEASDALRTTGFFIRSKLAPGASLFTDFVTGKTFLGEETDIKNLDQWAQRITPFAVSDVIEALEEEGTLAALAAAPAFVGAGVATFPTPLVEYFDIPKKLSPELRATYEEYDAAKTPTMQRQLRESNPNVRVALQLVAQARSELRRGNPEVDKALAKRGMKPETPEGIEEYLKKVPKEERALEKERIEFEAALVKLNYWDPWNGSYLKSMTPELRASYESYLMAKRADEASWIFVDGQAKHPTTARRAWIREGGDIVWAKKMDKAVPILKRRIRSQNPDIDTGLTKFYGLKPLEGEE